MHGVKRPPKTQATAAAREARKAKEAGKLQHYLSIQAQFFDVKQRKQKDQDALERTTELLTSNPELYTVWNYRRQVLLHLFDEPIHQSRYEAQEPTKSDIFASLRNPEGSSTQDTIDTAATQRNQESREEEDAVARLQRNRTLIEIDLDLTEHALRAHPKVYWIWNHRMWCLEHYPLSSTDPADWVWKRELKLVEKMLDLDPRNFHGWDCRRALVSRLAQVYTSTTDATGATSTSTSSSTSIRDEGSSSKKVSFPAILCEAGSLSTESRNLLLGLARTELAYSLRKIETNFSNFSAWHQRTKILPHYWKARNLNQEQIDQEVDKELDLTQQAMYTDPSDQSVWIYHKWLIESCLAGSNLERRKKVLENEIQSIQELLDLEQDSKWCAQSLACYKTALSHIIQDHKRAQQLRQDVQTLLHRLIEIDPDREGRYRDLLEGRAQF